MTMPACLPGDALAPRHEIEQRLADQLPVAMSAMSATVG
jgi:hypothetical protein